MTAPARGEGPTLAVVGATGAVGTVLTSLLSTRRDVWGEVRLVASRRSAGRRVRVRGEELVVLELSSAAFDGVDVAVFATPAEVSAHWAPPVAGRGTVVVDVSGAFRTDPAVPLVVAGVSGQRLRQRPRGIVAMPCGTTLALVDALAALHPGWGLTEVVATVCQGASSSGRAGVDRLYDELAVVSSRTLGQRGGDLRAAISDALPGSTSPFPAPLALNIVPTWGPLRGDGWTHEEVAVRGELRALLGVPELAVSVTCVQVPVVTCHTLVVHADFQRPITVADAHRALLQAPRVVLSDGDEEGDLPTPVDVVGSDPTWVGRVRQAPDHPRSLELVLCGDNLRRGSALNAAEVGELLAAELTGA